MNEQEQLEFFYEIYDGSLPRLGPGGDEFTLKALNILREQMPEQSGALQILDIGCGTGAQTLTLAKNLVAEITAVDNHQPYLDELVRRAKKAGVADKIAPCLCDMGDIEAEEESFDIIWSEGALYNLGFRNGLEMCRPLIKPEGGMAVSELCWLKPNPPDECYQFFQSGYPAMTDVYENLAMIKASGYRMINHFVMPDSAWLNEYYIPLEKRLESYRKKYSGDPARREIIESSQQEIDIFRKYSANYGYVFFIMQSEG